MDITDTRYSDMAVGDSKNIYTVVTVPPGTELYYNIAANSGTVEFVDRVITTVDTNEYNAQFCLYAIRVDQASCVLDECLARPFKIDYSCRLYITDTNTFYLQVYWYNPGGSVADVYINVRKIQIK
jgi:hypothetical protein